MSEITPNMQGELRERVAAGSYASIEELIRCALEALDREDILESELIEGVEAESDIALTSGELDAIRQEGIDRLNGKSAH